MISTYLFPILALVVILFTSLRPASKYLGSSLWAFAYAGFAILVLYLLSRSAASRDRLLSKGFVWSVGILFAAVSASFYQAADSLKETLQGQDQDDCTIIVVRQLLAFEFPYDQTSYFGNPCSPLFGALVPYVPFVASGLFFLSNSALLLVAIWLGFRLTDSSQVFALTILTALAIPLTLELMVNGSDLVFIGFGILLLSQLMTRAENQPTMLTVSTILAAVLASSRISMPILAVAYLIWLFQRHRKRILTQFAILTLVGLSPSLILYLVNPEGFSPLHLVGKSQNLVPGAWYIFMILATLAGFVFGGYLAGKGTGALPFLAVSFSPHLLFLSYGDLAFSRQFDFATWEGASYLMLLLPVFASLAANLVLRDREPSQSST
jgi:hypothetical protein